MALYSIESEQCLGMTHFGGAVTVNGESAVELSDEEVDILVKLIKEKKIQCGQCIWEYGTKKEPGWIHLSLMRFNKPNNQILYLGVK